MHGLTLYSWKSPTQINDPTIQWKCALGRGAWQTPRGLRAGSVLDGTATRLFKRSFCVSHNCLMPLIIIVLMCAPYTKLCACLYPLSHTHKGTCNLHKYWDIETCIQTYKKLPCMHKHKYTHTYTPTHSHTHTHTHTSTHTHMFQFYSTNCYFILSP